MSFNFCFYIPKSQEIEDNKIVLEELFFHVRLLQSEGYEDYERKCPLCYVTLWGKVFNKYEVE